MKPPELLSFGHRSCVSPGEAGAEQLLSGFGPMAGMGKYLGIVTPTGAPWQPGAPLNVTHPRAAVPPHAGALLRPGLDSSVKSGVIAGLHLGLVFRLLRRA